ncbi:uncharacterized protein DUF2848 [Brevibacterium sanguinis]|uniref:Uncharacterized protein DUF2848 n=2 Tax=Brevibacterium TaxID=1696 RepID=A0A366IFT9_9MICO|nr:uncharacterized protein DUF2848 [Brevibacterium sanguinis]RBP70252.1 uncharacterized protein DUF2848 [Brevibacterium celere]
MLTFQLPDGSSKTIDITRLLNAGYAGRNQASVQAHIDELAELGVEGPSAIPALYPVSPYLAQQVSTIDVQHSRTSGEAEWAMIIADDGVYITAACDHTDRELEVHGVAWSKNASPDVVAGHAWRYDDIVDHIDEISIRAWVIDDEGTETLIQDGSFADLLPPRYWLDDLGERGLDGPGTMLISGTVPMIPGVDQFLPAWKVTISDPVTGETISLHYEVKEMPAPIG